VKKNTSFSSHQRYREISTGNIIPSERERRNLLGFQPERPLAIPSLLVTREPSPVLFRLRLLTRKPVQTESTSTKAGEFQSTSSAGNESLSAKGRKGKSPGVPGKNFVNLE